MGDKTKSEPLRHPKEATEGDIDVVSGENPLAFSTNGKAEIKSKPCVVAAREAERIFSEQKTIGFDINPPENHLAQFAQRKTNEEGFEPCNTAHDHVRTENEADLVDISDLKEILEAEDKGSSVGSDSGKVCVDYAVEHSSHTLTRQDFQDSDELDEIITQAITVIDDGPFAFQGTVNGHTSAFNGSVEGTLTAVPVSVEDTLTAVPGSSEGTLTAVSGSAEGTLTAVPGSAEGTLTAVPGSAEGTLTAVPGSAEGTLTAVSGSAEGTLTAVPGFVKGTADTLFTSNLFPLHHGFQDLYMLFLVAISLCAICVNAAELIQPTQKLPECIDLMKQKHGNDCSPPNDPFFWKRFEELNKTCCSDYPGKVFHCQKLYKAGKEFTMIACLTPKDVPPAYTGKISKYDTPSPIFTLVKQNVSEVKKKTSRKSYQETLRYGADEKNRCQGPGQEILCEGNVDNLCMCKVGFHLSQAGKDCNQGIGAHDACHCEPLNCSRGNHAVRSFSQEINGSCHELFRNFTPHFACEKDPTPAPSVVSSTTKSSVLESSTSLPPNTTKSGGDDDANDDKKALKIALPILFAVLILVGGVLLFVFRCKLCCSPCGGEPATGTAKGSMGFKKNRESVSIDLSTGSTDPVGEELA